MPIRRRLLQIAGHFQECTQHFIGGFNFKPVGAEPRFITAEQVLFGCGQIAKVAVTKGYEEGGLWALLAELESDFAENFTGHRADTDVSKFKDLERDECCGGLRFKAAGAFSVDAGQINFSRRWFRFGKLFIGPV